MSTLRSDHLIRNAQMSETKIIGALCEFPDRTQVIAEFSDRE
jgi:hypothetical protein